MPAKFKRCVAAVKRQNRKSKKKYNPYAVCRCSTGFRGPTRHKKRRR